MLSRPSRVAKYKFQKLPTVKTISKKQFNTQEYRSGHNEAVLKTVCPKGTGVRIPLPAPIKMVYSLRVDLFLLPRSEGTNPKGSHTAAAEYITRNKVFAVSASRGDVGLNLYQSGTFSTKLAPSSIPLFLRQKIRTSLAGVLYFLSSSV